MEKITTYEIVPVAKPRMTQQDKWRNPPPKYTGTHWPRPVVSKWFAFQQEVVLRRVDLPPSGAHLLFVLPMPRSWSEAKKARMAGAPHETAPDLTNLVKALEDACYADDSLIWHYAGQEKRWGYEGSITITHTEGRENVLIHAGNPPPGSELSEALEEVGNYFAQPKVQDLGTANAWKETPELVIKCLDSENHDRTNREIGRFYHEQRCDTCGYVYRYDSS